MEPVGEEPSWVSLHPRKMPIMSGGNQGQMRPGGWVMLMEKEKMVPWGHGSTREVLDYVCPVPSLPQGSVRVSWRWCACGAQTHESWTATGHISPAAVPALRATLRHGQPDLWPQHVRGGRGTARA